MAMTVEIVLTLAGADSGPYSLYSNDDGFITPFETNVPKASLESGYTSILVPDGTTTIRVQSEGPLCTNFIDLVISGTTTTTTTAPPTTTTTSTTEALVSYQVTTFLCTDCGTSVGVAYIDNSVPLSGWVSLTSGFVGLIGGETTVFPDDTVNAGPFIDCPSACL